MPLENAQQDHAPLPPRTGKRRVIVIAIALVSTLALVAAGTAYALLGRDATTIIITPASQHISRNYTISAVSGVPDAAQNQVEARLISTNTPAQVKTVKTSGHLSLPATQARGMLVLRNWDTVPKTFQAGTVLPNWGADETVTCGDAASNMVIDATVTVPPAVGAPSNYGTAYVPGHVLEPGSIGNIPSTIGPNSCWYFIWAKGACPSGWFSRACWTVTAASDFTGGQDAYDGPAVQQSDIDDAAHQLVSANRPNPQQVLQRKMQPSEQLIDTPQCTPQITPYQQAGDKAAQVTVSVYFTCTGEVYDQKAAFALASKMLTTQAATTPGAGYALVGKVKTALTSVVFGDQGAMTLTITASGVWTYQFTDAQQQQLAKLLAGKSEQEALQLAGNQPGVDYVTIHLPAGQQRLPTDPQQITIVVQALPGT